MLTSSTAATRYLLASLQNTAVFLSNVLCRISTYELPNMSYNIEIAQVPEGGARCWHGDVGEGGAVLAAPIDAPGLVHDRGLREVVVGRHVGSGHGPRVPFRAHVRTVWDSAGRPASSSGRSASSSGAAGGHRACIILSAVAAGHRSAVAVSTGARSRPCRPAAQPAPAAAMGSGSLLSRALSFCTSHERIIHVYVLGVL
jgi:hypothetical protein